VPGQPVLDAVTLPGPLELRMFEDLPGSANDYANRLGTGTFSAKRKDGARAGAK
jgi:hypothetical protein